MEINIEGKLLFYFDGFFVCVYSLATSWKYVPSNLIYLKKKDNDTNLKLRSG